jgi:hypothetical protein
MSPVVYIRIFIELTHGALRKPKGKEKHLRYQKHFEHFCYLPMAGVPHPFQPRYNDIKYSIAVIKNMDGKLLGLLILDTS